MKKRKLTKKEYKKVLVYGDVHFPYHDKKALNILYGYMVEYKPNIVVINGDVADFYSISDFDKNPDHFNLYQELEMVWDHFDKVRKLNKKAEIYYIGDNHNTGRLQKYIYRHPELSDLDVLFLENLFRFKDYNIKYIGASVDYWKKETGYLKLGDVIIMHGDSKINGASTSKYAGYSAKNTMMNLQNSVIMNHVHRLAMVSHFMYDKELVGIEAGCLCRKVPGANWQQGFVTFELYKGKMVNPRLHYINNGVMIEDGKIYKG